MDVSAVGVATVAQPLFLKPLPLPAEPAPGVEEASSAAATAKGGFTIFTPAAFAILRSSFSSRFLSFSLRLLTSSSVLRLARWASCMSRKRTLWWCAYELVCSSYCATF